MRLYLDNIGDTAAPVDQLEKDRPQVPIRSLLQFSSVYDAPRHVPRINRDLDVRLPIDSAENLDGSPEFGPWNRLPAWHLTSQVASMLQSEGCVVANVHVENGHSKCDLSQCSGNFPASP